jgi:hypothetical protein
MKYLKLFESFNDIHELCEEYGITNYTINSDGSIDVAGDVDISDRELTKLPLKFRNVTGYFSCRDNELTSLDCAPHSVGGDFDCRNNQLTTLEGAPKSVGGNFNCRNNQLATLEGAPGSVGGNFLCHSNQLATLEGAPGAVGGSFDCYYNLIYNVWKLFRDYSKVELLNDYDVFRDDKIVIDRFNDFLLDIGKDSVEKVDGYINI